MSSILNIAVSGLNNAVTRIANAASNIVNASSTAPLPQNPGAYTGFTPQDVVSISADAGGNNTGVASQLQPRNPAYNTAYEPNSPLANAQGLVAAPNVDLASELVTASVAKNDFAASATVIKIDEKIQQALLDIKT